MRWITTNIKDSVMAFFGGRELSPEAMEDRTEDLRLFMLMELGDFADQVHPRVVRTLRYATDAQGLWYARGEMMAALAGMHGETVAWQKVERISRKFKGLIPHSLTSRPSSLTMH